MTKLYTPSLLLRALARSGYALLALLSLQALALITMSILQYSFYNQTSNITTGNSSTIGAIDIIVHNIGTSLPSRSTSSDQNVIATVAVAVLFLVIALLLALYLAKMMAGITYWLLRYSGKSTAKRLLVLKLTLAGNALIIIVIGALILPAVLPIVALNTCITILCLAAFLLEHSIISRMNLPFTKTL